MRHFIAIFFVVFLVSEAYSLPPHAKFGEALYLSENPPSGRAGDHKEHKGGERSGRREGQRGSGDRHSEHRAVPVKKFYLNIHDLSDNAMVYVMRPDGSMAEGKLSHDEGAWTVTFDTKPMDGSMDGIFNVYVVDKQVADGTLFVRVAKMNAINHSCGWGHKYKFDKERQRPKNLQEIPLEIVGHDLWDSYFHTRTMSGDSLVFSVLKDGAPVKNASLRLKTQAGWIKMLKTGDDGKASVQLIRDYYPENWNDFKARKKGNLLLTAEYEIEEKGEFEGMKYSKVKLITTFPWKYQPQRKEYTSYAYGLSIATLFAVVAGLAVYIHRERRKRPYREVVFDEKD